jgi:hypothetical protein
MSNCSTRKIGLWGGALALVAAACIGTPLAIAGAQDNAPTRGPVPASVFDGGPTIDRSQIPDFIPVLDRAGNEAGWAPSDLVIPPDGAGDPKQYQVIPVYADDLKTLVGHMVAGKGFVPLGTNPDDVPSFPVTTTTQAPSAGN